jgi:hypothetical protein
MQLLTLVEGNVEAGRDDTGLVQAAVKLDDNLAATVVVDELELADVACRRQQTELKRRKERYVLRLGLDQQTPGHAATEPDCAQHSMRSSGTP